MIMYLQNEGWNCWTNDEWTRRGYGKQRNSNIDIIIYKGLKKEDIKIRMYEHVQDFSDHKAI